MNRTVRLCQPAYVSLQSLKQQYRAEPSEILEAQILDLKRQADENYEVIKAELQAIGAAADEEQTAIAEIIGNTE